MRDYTDGRTHRTVNHSDTRVNYVCFVTFFSSKLIVFVQDIGSNSSQSVTQWQIFRIFEVFYVVTPGTSVS